MSSYPADDPEKTVIKTKVTVTKEAEITQLTGALVSDTRKEEEILRQDLAKLSKGVLKYLEGFRTFILRGNVVDLAIGIVIGAAFTAVVNSLVSDIITPLIPVSKTGSLSTFVVAIPHTYISLHVGAFINAVISFLIVAAVLYFFVVQPVNALTKLYHPQVPPPATRDCPFCYQAVNPQATRCPFCTSPIAALITADGQVIPGASPVESKEKEKEKEPILMLPESLEHLSDTLAERIAAKASARLGALAGSSSEMTETTTTTTETATTSSEVSTAPGE